MARDESASRWDGDDWAALGGQRLTLAAAGGQDPFGDDVLDGIGGDGLIADIGGSDAAPAPEGGGELFGGAGFGGLSGAPFGADGVPAGGPIEDFDGFSPPGFETASAVADGHSPIGVFGDGLNGGFDAGDSPQEAKGGNKDNTPGGGKGKNKDKTTTDEDTTTTDGDTTTTDGDTTGGDTTTDPTTDTTPTDTGPRSPTEGFDVSSYGLSGQDYIDSLTYGVKWGDGGQGTGTTLNFSFGTANSVYASGYSEPTNGFGEFSAHQKQATYAALDYWSSVADITFNEVIDSDTVAGDLRFARSSDPSTAWAYLPSGSTKGGDVWIGNSSWYDNMSEGTYGFSTLLHEIGHTIGLTHPHDTTGISQAADSSIDYLGNTVMSYYGAVDSYGYNNSFYPTSPMLNDVATLQYIYGVNNEHNATDTVYSWAAGEKIFESIWDAGGIDTIDWSNQISNAVINLNDGMWSELGPALYAGSAYDSRTVTIARGAVIENAIGGSGDDTIIGNQVDNRIEGGAGADTLTGGAGSDTFVYADAADAGDIISDFAAGAGGDVIDISALLASFGYAGADAFADGFVRTVQSGTSTLVQVDGDGGGDGFTTLVALENTAETDMNADNWVI